MFDHVGIDQSIKNKLWHYGIRETAHKLLSSYSMNGMQYVEQNKFNLSFQQIEYEVSQGSTYTSFYFYK